MGWTKGGFGGGSLRRQGCWGKRARVVRDEPLRGAERAWAGAREERMSERWPLPQAHDRCTALPTPFQNRTAERVAGNAVAPEFRGGGRARGCLGAILHNTVIGQRRSPKRSVALGVCTITARYV